MVRRNLLALAMLAPAALLLGCGPPWQVVSQAAPDPFFGQRKLVVMPVDFTGLRVGTRSEATYLEGLDDDGKAGFTRDKQALDAAFGKALVARAAEARIEVTARMTDAPFVIHPAVRWIEPGFFTSSGAAAASRVRMTVRITTPEGHALDEIVVEHGTPGSFASAATGARLAEDGAALGEIVAGYLKSRVAPGT